MDPRGQARGNWQTTHKKILATKLVKTRIKINLCELEDLKKIICLTDTRNRDEKFQGKKKSEQLKMKDESAFLSLWGRASPTIKPRMPTVVSVLK